MPIKDRVNSTLSRLTGYHLTKEDVGESHRLRQQLRATRAELKEAKEAKEAKAAAAKAAAAKKKRPEFPADYDEEMRSIIRSVHGWTMTDREKLFGLITAVRYVVKHQIPGDVVECGVWRGGSMQAVARTLTAAGDQSRDLHLFDTFEGMPPPSETDVRWDGQHATELLESGDPGSLIWAIATLEDVQRGFEGVDYPKDRIHYVKGKVEDTIPAHAPQQIAVLRLDTDWYESSLHELNHLYDRLAPGGVLVLDDYGYWEGQRKATDEWLERTGEPLVLFRMSSGRIAVKPRPSEPSP